MNRNREDGRANEGREGLCGSCEHARNVRSDRGSTFVMCQKSATDPAFPKYPRLPVLECAGYEAQARPDVP